MKLLKKWVIGMSIISTKNLSNSFKCPRMIIAMLSDLVLSIIVLFLANQLSLKRSKRDGKMSIMVGVHGSFQACIITL